jgi:SsrA-binding protein
VKKRERDKLLGAIRREGATLVPLTVYFNDRGLAKVEIGLARGKKKSDKRETEKARDWQRDKARLMRSRG